MTPVNESRRRFLGALGSGSSGLALASTASAATDRPPTHRSPDTSARLEAAASAPEYTTGVAFSDVKRTSRTVSYENDARYTPTEYEERAFTSTLAHSGPRSIPGVPEEVQYTVVVSTTASTAFVDDAGEFVAGGQNVERIENGIDYPGAVARTQFPDDEHWVGGHRGSEGGEPLGDLTDDSTLVGAVFDLGWDLLLGAIPYAGTALAAWDFLTDLADLDGDDSKEVVTFDYEQFSPESIVTTHRKFTVQMDRTDRATLDVRTGIDLLRRDGAASEFRHVVTLDPDSFVSDVDGHPFEHEIRTLVDADVISGYPDGTFRPERSVSRAEFAALIAEAFDPSARTRPAFADIDGHWAEGVIRRVAGAGFLSGYPDGTFRPDDPIRRVETVVSLDSGLGYTGGDPGQLAGAYADADRVPEWARQGVADAHRAWNGIETYPDPSTLAPLEQATRADAAKYVYDALY